jgi:hypothetical protein
VIAAARPVAAATAARRTIGGLTAYGDDILDGLAEAIESISRYGVDLCVGSGGRIPQSLAYICWKTTA